MTNRGLHKSAKIEQMYKFYFFEKKIYVKNLNNKFFT